MHRRLYAKDSSPLILDDSTASDATDTALASRPGRVDLACVQDASQDLVALVMLSRLWVVAIPAHCSPSDPLWI